MSANLLSSREGRVQRLTLNRVDKRNAIDAALCQAIINAVHAAEEDSAVRAILLDATGGVFCAGMDLDEASQPGAAERTSIHQELFTLGSRARKPIVAAVQGPALGGGVGLMLTAHVVIAAQGSTFGLTEIRTGMWPFVIFRTVAHAIGERRALELSLTSRIFSAAEALQWGMIHYIVPPFELDERAAAIAAGIANSSAEAIDRGLRYVREARGLSWTDANQLAASLRADQFASPDFEEGVRAFQEKRKPAWPSLPPHTEPRP